MLIILVKKLKIQKSKISQIKKIELFFRTLKVEEVYMFEYETYQEVVSRIPYFMRKSTIGKD